MPPKAAKPVLLLGDALRSSKVERSAAPGQISVRDVDSICMTNLEGKFQ